MKVKPTRKAKSGSNGFYEYETGCGKLKITILDGEDGFPIRVVVEPKGGGCHGGIEYLRRSVTYALECNLDLENFLTEVLDPIICKTAKEKMLREKKQEIKLSCAKAVSEALRAHTQIKK